MRNVFLSLVLLGAALSPNLALANPPAAAKPSYIKDASAKQVVSKVLKQRDPGFKWKVTLGEVQANGLKSFQAEGISNSTNGLVAPKNVVGDVDVRKDGPQGAARVILSNQ